MNNIKVNIKDVVTRTLNEERINHLKKSYSQLNESKGDDLFKKYFTISSNLINEGYSENEIKQYLNEFDNPLNNVGLNLKGAITSEIKEYAIKWLLDAFGFNQTFATSLSIVFADVNPLDLVRVFKDMSTCQQKMGNITGHISEAIIRYVGGSMTKTNNQNDWGGVGSKLIGNIFGEALTKSDFNKNMASLACQAIH